MRFILRTITFYVFISASLFVGDYCWTSDNKEISEWAVSNPITGQFFMWQPIRTEYTVGAPLMISRLRVSIDHSIMVKENFLSPDVLFAYSDLELLHKFLTRTYEDHHPRPSLCNHASHFNQLYTIRSLCEKYIVHVAQGKNNHESVIYYECAPHRMHESHNKCTCILL